MKRNATATQIPMPGIAAPRNLDVSTLTEAVRPGSEVMYHGHIKGGPRFGAKGVVQEIRGRRVIVDLESHGKWHVPFYLLSVPLNAA